MAALLSTATNAKQTMAAVSDVVVESVIAVLLMGVILVGEEKADHDNEILSGRSWDKFCYKMSNANRLWDE
jgi:hypothetical protein